MKEKILIIDFGGQYNQLIARRVREHNVYCELMPYTVSIEKIREFDPIGIILTGGPHSVYEKDAPSIDKSIFTLNVPILGICYGCQFIAQSLGGVVSSAKESSLGEYGRTETVFDISCPLFKDIPQKSITWMSHGDYISKLPDGFTSVAQTASCPMAAITDGRLLYGVQFHTEVDNTEYGSKILYNFLYNICHAKGGWKMDSFCQNAIADLRAKIGDGRVLLALSGGVDSSVLASLLSRAIGNKLTCVYVDHGCMRMNESAKIKEIFSAMDLNLVVVDAEDRFLSKLKNIRDPQEKRKIIGREFGYVFLDEAEKFGITKKDFFAQGTIYPDVIESGEGDAGVIKLHHNRVLPPEVLMSFKDILEPLSCLFKDEIRKLGKELGLPESIVYRQPFPGPGLAIRILGEVTKEKLDTLRLADSIFTSEIEKAGLTAICSQYFAVLTDSKSVGVMGDGRTYEHALVLRSVKTNDFMTASWSRIPYDVLDRVSVRIVNEIPKINRITYDITSKPPATVEWE